MLELGSISEAASQTNHVRTSCPFSRIEDALAAAKGNYPIEYKVAIRGKLERDSDLVHDEACFRTILRLRQFGTHEGDTLYIWLPRGSDMHGAS